MKFKVGHQIFDSVDRPLMVILSEEEKQDIAAMVPSDFRYCVYPDDVPKSKVKEFMECEKANAGGG